MAGFKSTDIGQIPEDWGIETLKEINKGKKESVNPLSCPDEVFEYYSIPAYQEGKRPILEKGANIYSQKMLLKEGAVLFGKLNPRVEKVWKVSPISPHRKIGSSEWLVLVPDEENVDTDYLYYVQWSTYVMPKAKGLVTGSTPSRQRVDPSSFYKLQIPLPSLPEQRNIIYILSKIQSAIETQEKIIQTTIELKKALMQTLFTEGLKGEPQKEDRALKWDKVKLGSLAEKGIVEFQNGFPCGQWNESGVGIPQIRPFNVTDFGKIDLTQIKSIETNKSIEKYKLKQNDIVFNNTNSEELVGKTALWQNGDGYVLSNHMTIIRIKEDTSINPIYLANFLHKKWFDGHYKMVCRRHVNQASVSIERLKDMDLPYPPIDVQDEIAKSFISIDKKIEFANAKHHTLQVLFKSMLHHLMTGQIRVKDLRFS